MKILIFFFLPFMAAGQSFADLIREYEAECSRLVPDSVEQHGTAYFNLFPVQKWNAGEFETVSYLQVAADTTWSVAICPEFKVRSGNLRFSLSVNGNTNTLLDIGGQRFAVYSDKNRIEKPVSRKCQCMVKAREPEPFSRHFWEWIKAHK